MLHIAGAIIIAFIAIRYGPAALAILLMLLWWLLPWMIGAAGIGFGVYAYACYRDPSMSGLWPSVVIGALLFGWSAIWLDRRTN